MICARPGINFVESFLSCLSEVKVHCSGECDRRINSNYQFCTALSNSSVGVFPQIGTCFQFWHMKNSVERNNFVAGWCCVQERWPFLTGLWAGSCEICWRVGLAWKMVPWILWSAAFFFIFFLKQSAEFFGELLPRLNFTGVWAYRLRSRGFIIKYYAKVKSACLSCLYVEIWSFLSWSMAWFCVIA